MSSPPVPEWIRAAHILNILFLSFLVRSGLQIFAAHPKLYWNDGCRPGSEWLRFGRDGVPSDGLLTGRDEERSAPSWLALPGGRNLGLGRHWHFLSVLGWVVTGVGYVTLLLATPEWRRLVPTSWDVLPAAWHAFTSYATLHMPPPLPGQPYNALQKLAYFGVVFAVAPLAILTGAAMSPSVAARFPWYLRLFGGRQPARSLHFAALSAFLAFTVVHVAMVVAHGFAREMSLIVVGMHEGESALAAGIGLTGLVLIGVVHWALTRWSLRSPRAVHDVIWTILGPVERALLEHGRSRQHYPERDRTPAPRVNGRPPRDAEYEALRADGFARWRLLVTGEVDHRLALGLDELKRMPAASQTTKHACIQGWSYVATWRGVRLADVLGRAAPRASACYVVFHAFDDKARSEPDPEGDGRFYETIDLALARDPQTILAYEMNGAPLTVPHGAPLRLRVESQLGFKMVKYLAAIELVSDFTHLGQGAGGWREDVQHYGPYAGI